MGMAVEHRYYGGAAFDGVPDFSAANLKYHSSRQVGGPLIDHSHLLQCSCSGCHRGGRLVRVMLALVVSGMSYHMLAC